MNKRKWYKQLYWQVVAGVILGILLGAFFPEVAIKMKPLGDGFIKLIRMMVTPIVFTTVILGITKMENVHEVGRVGIRALIYFEVITTLALCIGLVVGNISQPGTGLNIDIHSLDSKSIANYTSTTSAGHGADFLLNIIPNTLVGAFVNGEILSVLLVAIFFGFGILHSGTRRKSNIAFFENVSSILFPIIGFIMYLAPVGAFGAMAYTIGAHGIGTLTALGRLLADVYLTSFLFITIVLGGVAKLAGFRLWNFLKYIKEEIFIVLGTSSSESVLPQMLKKLEALGCGRTVVGLVLPIGYTFNLDGTSIYLTIAVLFIAQAFHIDLTFTQQLTILAILLLTSKGAAAVTGGGFIVLAATLSSMQILPVEGIILLLGVDKFMSEVRAVTNLIGNGVATIVVAKWEGDFDKNAARTFSVC